MLPSNDPHQGAKQNGRWYRLLLLDNEKSQDLNHGKENSERHQAQHSSR